MQQENSSVQEQQNSLQRQNQRKDERRRGRGRGRGRARRQQVEEHTRNHRSRSRSNERQRREHDQSQSASGNERDHSQSHSNDESNESQNGILNQLPHRTASIQTFADSISQNFVDFFFKCKHDKGFVFTPQERKKMKKEEDRLAKKNNSYKRIHWKDEHQWDPDREMEKVNKVFQNNTLNLPTERKEELKAIFKIASGMFADQVTEELYAFLFAILQIALIPSAQQQRERIKLMMKEVLSDSEKWRFFGYHFSSYVKLQLSKEQQQRVHQALGEKLLAILRQKI